MYQQITVVGRLGKDPEVKEVGETTLAKFSIAADSFVKKGEKHTEWFNVVVWGKSAVAVGDYLKKGSQAVVVGEIRTREYEKDGEKKRFTELVAEKVKFLGGGEKSEKLAPKKQEVDDSDIPF